VNWREFARNMPQMPDDEATARKAHARLVEQIETEVDEADRGMARDILGDTWGEAATFNGWSLETKESE